MRRRRPGRALAPGEGHWGLAALLGLLAAGFVGVGCGASPDRPPPGVASPPHGSLVIATGGTDYAAPIYQEVGNLIRGQGITLNYRLDGLTIGTSRLRSGGPALLASASSTPLGNLPRISDSSELYVPVAFGAVAVIYNLPGLHAPLKLRGNVLADIFLGRVRSWNAHEIAATNPHTKLPPIPITVIHRADPATATALFTQYLAASSPRWRKSPGSGATVGWPTGFAESNDDALRQTLGQTPGAISYTDQAAALQDQLPAARLRTAAGGWVAPTLRSVSAVGLQRPLAGQLSLKTIDARVPGAYPAVAEVYMLTTHDPCDAGFSHPEATGVLRLLDYMLGAGQNVVRRFSFAPLPPTLLARARSEVKDLRCGGQSI